MPKGKYVESLFKAYNENNHIRFKQVAKKIIEDEKDKSHYKLANSLQQLFNSFPNENNDEYRKNHSSSINGSYFNSLPRDDKGGADLVSIIKPNYYLEDVVLSDENKNVINRIMLEYHSANELRGYNLDAKRRLLFCGPPGCGKTITAQALANEINLPLLYVHMDSLISSYLGDTASNLRKIFQYAGTGKWVVFFDEFDTIGKSREDENEHGELKRSVNTFLQMLDNFKTKTLFIAATNHQHLLDSAIWRRFDEILYFNKPGLDQIQKLLKKKLRVFKTNINFEKISGELDGMSHSQIERICKDAIKACIIDNRDFVNEDVIKECIDEEKRRKKIYDGLMEME
ncbi:AAA family ATPase [Halonatronum saccharophilum]|uniref:AAA family ATPase n=1 Tax=Halonatronum saccharophilum TaxID=150060 RepID=UPI00047F4A61|nr:ATP-binding protein [Halonatronum saccharophilum]